QSQVHPLPHKLTFQQGAAIGVPYATAYFALVNRGQCVQGETVFIHGASGGVGTAAVQMSCARKLNVIGTAGSAKGRELVKQEGARHVLDHSQADYLEELMKLTGSKGVDLILEM